MLGLRAKDPEFRQRFFSLYHESLGKTLFNRLQYIIQIQDWEALSDVFWLKQGLDLLLAILIENEPITLAPNSARVPPLMASGPLPERPGLFSSASEQVDNEAAPLTFEVLVSKHTQFLNDMSRLQVIFYFCIINCLCHYFAINPLVELFSNFSLWFFKCFISLL